MSKLPEMDLTTAAIAMAVCDLLVTERARFKALLELLKQKGLLSATEVDGAMQSIAAIAPESSGEDWQRLLQKLQERTAVRLQELMLHSAPTGPAH